jgi:hypothetical protein
MTKTTVFVCWNIFFKKSIWNRFAAGTRLERHTCSVYHGGDKMDDHTHFLRKIVAAR